MNKTIVLAAAMPLSVLSATFFTIASAEAQQEVATVPGIVVSGGLTPVPVKEYGRAFSVITAADIERRQFIYATDALRALPGVSVNRAGALGGLTQVRIRGAEGNHTLVLIDGVEVSAPEQGEFDFASLLASDIERIEVLRGPQSALYGSNALGGVISITTKSATKDGLEVGAEAEGGTDETGAGQVYGRAKDDAGSISFSASFRRNGGFDVSGDPDGEDDEDRNLTLNGKGAYDLTGWLTVGATLRFTDRDSDFDRFNFGAADRDGLITDRDDGLEARDLIGSAYATADMLGGKLAHRLQVNHNRNDVEARTAGAQSSDSTGTRTAVKYQGTVALDAETLSAADHSLTLAAEWERETFENNDARFVFDPSQLDEQERTLHGLIADYQGTFLDRFNLQAGLRHDFNDDFEDATTFSLGASYILDGTGTRFHASGGRAVQNPTLIDQFGFIPGTFQGNPDLEPEESIGWDVGIEQPFFDDRVLVDVTYFRQTLDNEIVTVFPPPDFIAFTENQDGESKRQGVEVSVSANPIRGLNVNLAYTYLDAEDVDGQVEIRRPKHEVGADVSYRFLGGKATVTVDGRYVAGNFDNDFTSPFVSGKRVALDDYVLANVLASYKVMDTVELYGRVQNLFDTDYEEQYGYDSQGIVGFLGVKARW
ncbi:MAG: TonB-dependent receptor [Alphaproteobacteria bacterium]|nr:TonB-dependent receptor [Alphaproteobacteria bacterium]